MAEKYIKIVLNGGKFRYINSEEEAKKAKREEFETRTLSVPASVIRMPSKKQMESAKERTLTDWTFRKIKNYLKDKFYVTQKASIHFETFLDDKLLIGGQEAQMLQQSVPMGDYFNVSVRIDKDDKTVTATCKELCKRLVKHSEDCFELIKIPAVQILAYQAKMTDNDKKGLKEWVALDAMAYWLNKRHITTEVSFHYIQTKTKLTTKEAFGYIQKLVSYDNNFIFKYRQWTEISNGEKRHAGRFYMDSIRIDHK